MMKAIASLITKEISRSLAKNEITKTLLIFAPLIPVIVVIVAIVSVSLIAFMVVSGQNGGGCGTTVSVGAPGPNIKTSVDEVRYFESQGISNNGAAGIDGNTQQESGDNPKTPGGGLAQWLGSRWSDMVTWTTAQGYPGDSPNPKVAMAGQLMFLVYDLRTKYASLLAELNAAPDAATAATMFETIYEVCSGVTGYLQVTSGSACNDPARRQNATTVFAASGSTSTAVPASFVTGGTCVAVGGSGGDPIPNFRPGRDDMGVDACANPGMPILAPADSVLVDIVPSWYGPQPLLLFQFNPPLAGTYQNDQYWFVAEQIIPVSTTRGTMFTAGQPVATYAPSGSCLEIGWGSPANSSRTLVPTDAHPPKGALTPEAEAFKVFFHIPWVGQSP